MVVGVPTEIKDDENRVAITPSGVAAFSAHDHRVVVQSGAGVGSAIADDDYRAAGASVLETVEEVWAHADLILKVKEPLNGEFELMRPGQVLFTYLHLAASKSLTRRLLDRDIVGIGYETVQFDDGTLPLLVPMSEVAGRLSIQAGAKSLEMISGGREFCCRRLGCPAWACHHHRGWNRGDECLCRGGRLWRGCDDRRH